MPQHESCIHEDDFRRLESLVTKVFDKMDKFLEDIHGVVVNDTARQSKVDQMARDIDRAFHDIRKVVEKIGELSDWRQRFEGGVKVMLAIPILCTVITTGVALYKMMGV